MEIKAFSPFNLLIIINIKINNLFAQNENYLMLKITCQDFHSVPNVDNAASVCKLGNSGRNYAAIVP